MGGPARRRRRAAGIIALLLAVAALSLVVALLRYSDRGQQGSGAVVISARSLRQVPRVNGGFDEPPGAARKPRQRQVPSIKGGVDEGPAAVREPRPLPEKDIMDAARKWRQVVLSEEDALLTPGLAAALSERQAAEAKFREGGGFLWFHHMAKAAGSSICKSLMGSSIGWYSDNRNCNYVGFDAKEPVGYHPGLILLEKGARYIWDTVQKLKGCPKQDGCRAVTSEARFIPADGLVMLLEPALRPSAMEDLSNFVFITNFRDPVERLSSAYRYRNYRLSERCKSLEHCSQTVFSEQNWRNTYVRQLVGQVFGQDEAEGAQWLFGSDYVADVFHDVTEQDLNFAKAILMRMSVIIMTDTLQRDLCVMGHVLNIQGLKSLALNKTVGNRSISTSVRETLEARNSLDMELFRFARSLADERAKAYPECG